MEFLAAALVFGGFWFWTLIIGTFFLIMFFNENDRYGLSTVTLIGIVLVLEWLGVTTLLAHPWYFLGGLAVYLAMGGPWSILKWFTYIKREASKFAELKLSFIKKVNSGGLQRVTMEDHTATVVKISEAAEKTEDGEHQKVRLLEDVGTTIPENLKDDFRKHLYHHNYAHASKEGFRPDAGDNKGRIVSWIIWWPTSMFWTFLDEPIRKFANFVYSYLSGTYERMTKKVYAKFGL